ncbi:hypothetical protein CDAR_202101 [Caerostris darwini]|uniref:Gnk2-homologous domain-containing protein n=1 Tax=Caerostris darwini TaxID=1538125 RepID=A0AAV4RM66_9ARAC|nr:hypothetical protein CDAR_202101 [Caerostris darwini]
MEVLILRGTKRRCERIAGVSVVCVPVTQSNCRRAAALPRSRVSKKPSSLSRTVSINALFVDIAPNYDVTPRTLEPAVFPRSRVMQGYECSHRDGINSIDCVNCISAHIGELYATHRPHKKSIGELYAIHGPHKKHRRAVCNPRATEKRLWAVHNPRRAQKALARCMQHTGRTKKPHRAVCNPWAAQKSIGEL